MASESDILDIRKALFTSPGVNINELGDSTTKPLYSRLQIDQETDDQLKKSQRDAHEKRMKMFRQMAKQLADDDWLYPPMEKLIGLK